MRRGFLKQQNRCAAAGAKRLWESRAGENPWLDAPGAVVFLVAVTLRDIADHQGDYPDHRHQTYPRAAVTSLSMMVITRLFFE